MGVLGKSLASISPLRLELSWMFGDATLCTQPGSHVGCVAHSKVILYQSAVLNRMFFLFVLLVFFSLESAPRRIFLTLQDEKKLQQQHRAQPQKEQGTIMFYAYSKVFVVVSRVMPSNGSYKQREREISLR